MKKILLLILLLNSYLFSTVTVIVSNTSGVCPDSYTYNGVTFYRYGDFMDVGINSHTFPDQTYTIIQTAVNYIECSEYTDQPSYQLKRTYNFATSETCNANNLNCVYPSCPAGYQRIDGVCEPICFSGEELVNHQCVPVCLEGQSRVDGVCTYPPCPEGQERVDDVCLPICAEGQIRINGECDWITCPSGQHRESGQCVDDECPTGEQMVNGICTNICNNPSTHFENGMCVPNCPDGYDFVNGQCVPHCPLGTILWHDYCVDECPAGYVKEGLSCRELQEGENPSSSSSSDSPCHSGTDYHSQAVCYCQSVNQYLIPSSHVDMLDIKINNLCWTFQKATCSGGATFAVYFDPHPCPESNSSSAGFDSSTPSNSSSSDYSSASSATSSSDGGGGGSASSATSSSDGGGGGSASSTASSTTGGGYTTTSTPSDYSSLINAVKSVDISVKATNNFLTQTNKGLNDFKHAFDMYSIASTKNASDNLKGLGDVKKSVDTQGKAITDKLGDVIKAIDANGTTKIDLNATNAKLDTLHYDNNRSQSVLNKLLGLFDANGTVPDVNISREEFALVDLLPDDTFFETNKLNLDFNNYHGDCYLETATFVVAGKEFVFPPSNLMSMIPFQTIANLFMAFLYMVGLRDFLRT